MKTRLTAALLCTGLFFGTSSNATFDPLVYAALEKQISQATDAAAKAEEQLNVLKDTKSSIDDMKGDLSGHDTLADMDNSLSDVKGTYESTPSNWRDALTMTQGKNAAQTQAMGSYDQSHPTLTQQTYNHSFNPKAYKSYKNEAQQTRGSTVLAQSIYDQTNKQNDEINKLSKQLDTASTNKQALSAVGRLIAENAYHTVQMNKLLSMLVMQQSSVQAQAQDAENANVRFNQ